MTTVLLVLTAWFTLLGVFVWLKGRQPRYRYPSPPVRHEAARRDTAA
jgi:hypothetical protein